MYSLFDYMLSPPVRTVVVVTEDQLNDLRAKQYNDEIKTIKATHHELEAAYNRRKSSYPIGLIFCDCRQLQVRGAWL
jgi:hypothetical protein